jgi:hypothetical protein
MVVFAARQRDSQAAASVAYRGCANSAPETPRKRVAPQAAMEPAAVWISAPRSATVSGAASEAESSIAVVSDSSAVLGRALASSV